MPVDEPRPTSSRSHPHRTDIEGLRAVAVIAVVLFHAGFTTGGYVGVDVFFVISGYLITGLLGRELREHQRLSFAGFYARRARRLLPASVLVIVVTVLASARWLHPLAARDVVGDARSAALYVANYHFIAQRTDYLNTAAPSPLLHYWSLAVEEQFYALWPLVLLGAAALARRTRRASAFAAVLVAIGIVSFFLSVRVTHTSAPWAYFSLATRAWEFVVGGLLALVVHRVEGLHRPTAAIVGWLGAFALLWSVVHFGAATAFPGSVAAIPVLATVAILTAGAAAPARGVSHLLSRRPLRAGGRISYSWYLWHWPVLVIAPAVVGRSLGRPVNLVLVVASGALAALTTRMVEEPLRFAPRLAAPPRPTLAAAAALTAVALVATAVAAQSLPSLRGARPATVLTASHATAPIASSARTAAPEPAVARVIDALYRSDEHTVAAATHADAVPSNLQPSLEHAHADKARPFLDGCDDTFTDPTVHRCTYGAPDGRSTIVLLGDSHAAQWFPAFDEIANERRWKLENFTKAACPLFVTKLVWSPVLGRHFDECTTFVRSALARIAAERPAVVVIGIARHYGPENHFQVFAPPWIDGLRTTVRELRTTGAKVVLLSQTAHPATDVPDCLSGHLRDIAPCEQTTARAVDSNGLAAEAATAQAAGARFVNLTPLMCSATTCPAIVGNILVYRDDNHVTTTFAKWLAPVFDAELQATLMSRPHAGA
jgi:peptidoglycan/LPS O-acetylase OafA/YrhL